MHFSSLSWNLSREILVLKERSRQRCLGYCTGVWLVGVIRQAMVVYVVSYYFFNRVYVKVGRLM